MNRTDQEMQPDQEMQQLIVNACEGNVAQDCKMAGAPPMNPQDQPRNPQQHPVALLDEVFCGSLPFDGANAFRPDAVLSSTYSAAERAGSALGQLYESNNMLAALREEETVLDRELQRQAALGKQLLVAFSAGGQ